MSSLFALLNGGNRFSSPDLRNAYNQALDESRKLTVNKAHPPLLCFNCLLFSIALGAAILQQNINGMFQWPQGVHASFDNVLISQQLDDKGEYSKSVLQRLNEYGGP